MHTSVETEPNTCTSAMANMGEYLRSKRYLPVPMQGKLMFENTVSPSKQ